MSNSVGSRLVRAWLATGVSDFLFACVLSICFYGSTFTRLWQGVASVPFGKQALGGGVQWTIIGIVCHFAVAFTWSAILLFLVEKSAWIRGVLVSRFGVLKVAAVYGPIIWMVMSLVVIPLLVRRPPRISIRWWIQGIGHIPFVGLPLAWGVKPTR